MTAPLLEWSTFERILIVGMGHYPLPEREEIDDKRELLRLGPQYSAAQNLPKKLYRFIAWYVSVFSRFWRAPVGCINCRSLSALPLCVGLKLATGAKLIYDAHELETETPTLFGFRKWLAKALERLLIGFSDAVIVVGPAIAGWYRTAYPGMDPKVVRNLPEFLDEPHRTNLFEGLLALPANAVVFLYEGQLCAGRGIEATLEAFSRAPVDRHVVFLGFGPYTDLIKEASERFGNIHLLPAVPSSELRKYTMAGDIGLCLIEPNSLSYTYSLPNKLFEYLGAGLPVIATKLPELLQIVDGMGAGWTVSNNADELLQLIGSITRESIRERSERALHWTRQNSWQRECLVLKSIYTDLGFADS
ncbi:MAG TPA: glycosyltransferase family 4 protein [Reyranella sp.]|nr:glycosyltransferase family 4 protein [Reyranella sp.]